MGLDPAGTGVCTLNANDSQVPSGASALDDFLSHFYRHHPVNATFTGLHAYDGVLPDWSLTARECERQEMQQLRDRLSAAHPEGARDTWRKNREALDAELARANIDVRMAEFDSGFFHDRNPVLWIGEAIFGSASLMMRPFAPVEERLPNLIARLNAIPPFLENMRRAIRSPIPEQWVRRAHRECEAAEQLFGAGLNAWLSGGGRVGGGALPAPVVRSAQLAARTARQAFAETATWLAARPHTEADGYSCGEMTYSRLLQRGHYCNEPPRALLVRAENAMVEATAALDAQLREFGADWAAVQAAMAADAPTLAEYPEAFEKRWTEVRDGVLPHDALTWPNWPIRYVTTPEWAREAAPSLYWLHYRSPAPFDRYDVHDYQVAPIHAQLPIDVQQQLLANWNHSVITLNHVVHHGGMGHHLQNWHAIHKSTSRVGIVSAVDAASRVNMLLGGSMAEGWACYATALAEEFGVLSPLECLSEQHSRVRFLARAIVDIRLHLGDWTFDECVSYFVSQVGMAHAVAVNEVAKASMFPATAIMYWLGTSSLLALRDEQQRIYGDGFSLRSFHDGVLKRGAIPVLLVSQLKQGKHAQ